MRKKFLTVVLSAITACVLVSFCAIPVFAAQSVDVGLVASETKVAPGDTFQVNLSFNNAAELETGVVCFLGIIEYDTDKLKFVQADFDKDVKGVDTSLYKGDPKSQLKILYTDPRAGTKNAFKKNGTFVTVTFQALEKAEGIAPITVNFDAISTVEGKDYKIVSVPFNKPETSVQISAGTNQSENQNPVFSKPATGGSKITEKEVGKSDSPGFSTIKPITGGSTSVNSGMTSKTSSGSVSVSLGGNQSVSTTDKAASGGLSTTQIALIITACVIVGAGAAVVVLYFINKKGKNHIDSNNASKKK